MSKKKPAPIRLSKLPPLPLGTMVVVQRPHLWAGGCGEVVAYNETTTEHKIRIASRYPDEYFHAVALAEDLKVVESEPDLGAMLRG